MGKKKHWFKKYSNINFKKIKTLNLSKKSITDLNDIRFGNEANGIENFINLERLYCDNNELTNLNGIEKLNNLEYLYCNYNKLNSLKGVGNSIKWIYCNSNELTNLNGIEKSTNLKVLDCSDNKLTNLNGIEKLTNLNHLDCSNNKLTNLNGIEKLTNLDYLNCSDNKLTNLNGIEKLTNLNHLDCSNNKLTNLNGIEKLINLKYLHCENNKLNNLNGIENLIYLKSLYFDNNPVELFSEDFRKILYKIGVNILSFIVFLIKSNYSYLDIGDDIDINVTYLPKSKVDLVDDPYNNNLRVSTKIGKILSNFTSNKKDIEISVNKYKTEFKRIKNLFHFEIVQGNKIKYWYLYKNTVERGTLGNSCMKSNKKQSRVNFYTKIPNVCKMLILKENKEDTKIIGRALIWKTNKGFYMDRIYTSYDSDVILFENYAKKENYSKYVSGKKLEVNLGIRFFVKFPYMDTFKFYYYLNGKLTNYYIPKNPHIILDNGF